MAMDSMEQQGSPVAWDSFCSLLQECTIKKSLMVGRRVHSLLVSNGKDSVVPVGDYLIRHFASCGSLLEAILVFCKIAKPSVYTWYALILAHATHGNNDRALDLYWKMQHDCILPDAFIFTCILKVCGRMGAIEKGESIHDQIIKTGLQSDLVVGNAIIDMYAKCGRLDKAYKVFKELPEQNVLSWGAMIAGYADHGDGLYALEFFKRMQEQGIRPNAVTLLCTLKACCSIAATEQGKLIHGKIVKIGLELDVILGSTLTDMYAKCESLEDARYVFDNLLNRNIVSWSVMIAAYAEFGSGHLALELFGKMQQEGITPDRGTFLCSLKACSSIGALKQGKLIQDQVIKSGLEDVAIMSALVDMYANCGSLKEAHNVFNRLLNRDIVLWGAMIAGYAQHGSYRLAVQCLKDMQRQGLKLNSMICTSILSACSQAGEVEEGHCYFKSMVEDHCVKASLEHFNCMVDLLGSAGCLKEAEQVLLTMPISPDVTGWTALLSACRTYGNVKLGRQCFDQIVRLDPCISSVYVLMSNIYADALMWDDLYSIRELQSLGRAWKKPGVAWIEANRNVFEFVVGDDTNVQEDQNVPISTRSKTLMEAGYVPQLDLVMGTISREDSSHNLTV